MTTHVATGSVAATHVPTDHELLDSLSELVYRVHPETLAALYVNAAVGEIYGYSPAEWLADPGLWERTRHPDDKDRVTSAFLAARDTGSPGRLQYRIVRRDGVIRWVKDCFAWILDARGAPAALTGVMEDITASRDTEHTLRESEAKFSALFHSNPASIVLTTMDGRIVDCNRAFEDAAGRARSDVLGRTMVELGMLSATDRLRIVADIERLGGDVRNLEVSLERPAGELRQVVMSAQTISLQGVPHRLAADLDITERKRTEVELGESEARFRGLIEHSTDGILLLGENGVIRFCTPATERILGYVEGELVGRHSHALVHPGDRALAREYFLKSLAGAGTPSSVVIRARHKNGQWIHLEGTLSNLLHVAGVRGLVNNFRDVTARVEAAAQLRDLSQMILTERETERKRVAAALHHDAGSLAVGGAAHLDAIEAAARRGDEGEMRAWVRRMRNLLKSSVRNLKRVAVEIRPPELDVLGLRVALRQHFTRISAAGPVGIRFRESLGARHVDGDTATVLFRVAQEALTNAITHGGANSVDVRLDALRTRVRLSIRDNGRGFDPASRTPPGGRHLGIDVMSEMARSVGGTLTIERAPRRGTVVCMNVPLESSARAPERDAKKHARPTATANRRGGRGAASHGRPRTRRSS